MTDSRIVAAIAVATPNITSDEGFRARAYQDTVGVWTVGYGQTGFDVMPGSTTTIATARLWRDKRIAEISADLSLRLPWWVELAPAQMAALIEMAYQLGISGLLNFKFMLSALRAGDWQQARADALNSLWARQAPARAQRTAAQLIPPSPASGKSAPAAASRPYGVTV